MAQLAVKATGNHLSKGSQCLKGCAEMTRFEFRIDSAAAFSAEVRAQEEIITLELPPG